jgi:hypothetical protein
LIDVYVYPAAVQASELIEGGAIISAKYEPLVADLRLFAFFIDKILRPILGGVDDSGNSCSVSDALVALSAAAHVMIVIFRTQGSAFVQPQLYHDFMSSVKNLYTVVARFQVTCASVVP